MISLIRGTCQQFKFKIPYYCDNITKAKVIFKQPKNIVKDGIPYEFYKTYEKDAADETVGGIKMISGQKSIYVDLDPVDTNGFECDSKAYMQLKALTSDGIEFSSRIIPITIYPTLDEDTLS